MLGAIALDRVGFGPALVVAFSLGLASVLTFIGPVFLYAGWLFEWLPFQNRILCAILAGSALFITFIGIMIAVRTLSTL